MTKKKILIANYSQEGHYMYKEDTWGDFTIIQDEDSFLRDCKLWHKESAKSFSDYPFGGLFSFKNIKFQIQEVIIDESGQEFFGRKVDCDPPDYYNSVKDKFYQWLNSIKQRLPKLIEAREARHKMESELATLAELSQKYISTP